MPSYDETSPVGPRAGSVRRPPPARRSGAARGVGGAGGVRRPSGGSRGRTTAERAGGGSLPPRNGSRPPGAGGGRGGSGGRGGGGGGGRGGGRPSGGGAGGRGRPRKKKLTKKQRRNRRLLIALATVLGMFVLGGAFVGVVYASTEVPDLNTIQAAQTTTVYYADGKTELARLGSENRTNVSLDQVSRPARYAVLSAENRSFYTDPGISFTGIIRAAWNDVSGGSTQGGSTITQQYVKNAILKNSSQTFTRKFKELFLAVKLDNNSSKNEILQNYLNTIYFGRGAYGIEAAANTYFGVHAAQLTAQQGAVLAVLIRSPSYYDPAVHPQEAKDRWGQVLDGMVKQHWLSASERAASQYPQVLPRADTTSLGIPSGPQGFIVTKAIAELKAKGYTDEQIRAGGLRITTTVPKAYEDAAISAVNQVMDGQPKNLRQALVAVDPRTGAVLAYYGGPKSLGTGAIDYGQAHRQPGSSMKPYVLATGLEQGIGVESIRNGSSPQTFPDGLTIRNAGSEACSACSLVTAITESLNTVFYGLAYDVGPNKVRQTAVDAMDLPDAWPQTAGLLAGKKTLTDPKSGTTGASIGIGQYELRPIDQAVGFATFAAGGIQRDPYFVAKVTDSQGKLLMQNNGVPGKQVMPADVAHDVTFSLEKVAAWSHDPLAGGRPSASKTGTQNKWKSNNDNTDAWMVGYTPSISTAVWQGSDSNEAIVNAAGRPIYGAGLPGQIWKKFMDTVLKGTPIEKLPDAPLIQGDTGHPVIPVPTTTAPPSSSAPAPTTPPAATTPAHPTTTAPTTTTASTSTSTSPSSASQSPPQGGIPLPGGGQGGNGSQSGGTGSQGTG